MINCQWKFNYLYIFTFLIYLCTSCTKELQEVKFDYVGNKLVLNGFIDSSGFALIRVSRTQNPNYEFHVDSLIINNARVVLLNGGFEIPLLLRNNGLYQASSFQLNADNVIKLRVEVPDFTVVETQQINFQTTPEIANKSRQLKRIIEPSLIDSLYTVEISYIFTIKDSPFTKNNYLIFSNPLLLDNDLINTSIFSNPLFIEQFSPECFSYPCFQDDCFDGLEIQMETNLQLKLKNLDQLSNESQFLDKIEIFITKIDEKICNSLSLGRVDSSPLPFVLTQPSLTSSNIINGYGHVIGSNSILISK